MSALEQYVLWKALYKYIEMSFIFVPSLNLSVTCDISKSLFPCLISFTMDINIMSNICPCCFMKVAECSIVIGYWLWACFNIHRRPFVGFLLFISQVEYQARPDDMH